MDAAGIVGDLAIAVAHGGQRAEVVAPRILSALGAERKSGDILDKRRTVELTGVHYEALIVVDFEGVGHVRQSEELSGEEELEIGAARQLP